MEDNTAEENSIRLMKNINSKKERQFCAKKVEFEREKMSLMTESQTYKHSLAIRKRYRKQLKSKIIAVHLNRTNSIFAFGLKLGKASSVFTGSRVSMFQLYAGHLWKSKQTVSSVLECFFICECGKKFDD